MTESRYVTEGSENPERYRLFRLCDCTACGGKGKVRLHGTMTVGEWEETHFGDVQRCPECRGEGRIRQEIATCATPEAVGVAIVTLAREGEWADGCQFGLLDSEGETNAKWLILPWPDTARTVSAAARTLAKSKRTS